MVCEGATLANNTLKFTPAHLQSRPASALPSEYMAGFVWTFGYTSMLYITPYLLILLLQKLVSVTTVNRHIANTWHFCMPKSWRVISRYSIWDGDHPSKTISCGS